MLRRTTRRLGAAAAGMALLATAACGGGGAVVNEDGTATITVGRATTATGMPVVLGVRHGFFEEEGLRIEEAHSASGSGAVSQLINGEVTVASGGASGPIAAISRGIELQFVSGAIADHEVNGQGQYHTLVAPDSGIQSFADLQGRVVAVNSLECCWEFWTRESVRMDGGDPHGIELTQIPFGDQITAMREGRVDAVTTLQPFATQLQEEGFVSIGDPAAIAHENPENGNTNYFMTAQFVEENPDLVEAWQRALARSSEYANNHPDEVREAVVERTGTDPELVARAPLPLYVAEIDRRTLENEARFLVEYGVLEEAPSYEDLVWEGASER